MEKNDLEALYRKYYKPLFLYALSFTGSGPDAEDLVSDTFIRAYLSYTADKGDVLKWMMVVLRHIFIDQYRRKRHIIDDGETLLAWFQDDCDILTRYIQEERKRWVYRQIYMLPRREREIMLLTAAADMSDTQIAEIVHLDVGHVRVIKHRVRRRLAELARKEGYL